MARRSALVNVMAAAVIRAARGLNRDFGEIISLQASEKGARSFSAAAVRRAGDVLARELLRARPGFGYRGDVAGKGGGPETDCAWLVTPLDGIDNFRRGIPAFATVIGVEERGSAVAGAIYDPLRDELFWAERGVGAYANRQRIRVSNCNHLEAAMVAYSGPADENRSHCVGFGLASRLAALRQTGAVALDIANVASGRFDGVVAVGPDRHALEVGALLVREAGGLASRITLGAGDRALAVQIAANAKIASGLRKALPHMGEAPSAA